MRITRNNSYALFVQRASAFDRHGATFDGRFRRIRFEVPSMQQQTPVLAPCADLTATLFAGKRRYRQALRLTPIFLHVLSEQVTSQ